jgi:exopolysaccharide biosynthesis WecB/TagA/CpsF family protein
MQSLNSIKILGISFLKGNVYDVLKGLKNGGLLVVPAAPALSNIKNDASYYDALLTADIVIPDSGYMSLIWNLFHREKITRISGLKFLTEFLNDKEVSSDLRILLVNPNKSEAEANLAYLRSRGYDLSDDISYLAPHYTEPIVEDKSLLHFIEEKRPKYVVINIGGGTQEKLGAYLKKNLSYSPAIICTGAAISFLTGRQARIPAWADKLYLGWLYRCIQKPSVFIPRYFKAFKLALFIFRYEHYQPAIPKFSHLKG